MKNKLIIIILSMILILASGVFAEEQYLMKGTDRVGSYSTTQIGNWNSITTPVLRSSNYVDGNTPVVDDINDDDINDIIIFNGNDLEVLRYDGNNLLIQDSITISDVVEQTVGLIDYDNDNKTEIIIITKTNMSVYEFNGSLNLEKTFAHGLTYYNVLGNNIHVIKCAKNNFFLDNATRCFTTFATNGFINVLQYKLLQNNITSQSSVGQQIQPKGFDLHLADLDSDGYLNVLTSTIQVSSSPRTYRVLNSYVDVNGALTTNTLYTDVGGHTGDYARSDLTITNLDGSYSNGLEITFAESNDGTNYDMTTINKLGNVIEDNYYGLLVDDPEGTLLSANGFITSTTTYSPNINDVCFYLRDGTTNDDTIMCASLVAGVKGYKTSIEQIQNFSVYFNVHETNLFGTTGVLTSLFATQDTTIENKLAITYQQTLIPVDYQINGGMDLIGVSNGLLSYHDDAVINDQVQIINRKICPQNNICKDTTVLLTYTLEDDESDSGTCNISEYYLNDTLIEVFTTKTFDGNQDITAYYTPDVVGSFKIKVDCSDQYNYLQSHAFNEYVTIISNDTSTCLNYGSECITETYETTAEETLDETFNDDIDSFFGGIGVVSGKSKIILGVILCFLIAMALYIKTNKLEFGLMGFAGGSVVAFIFGLLSILPMIMFIILCVTLLLFRLKNMWENV